MQSSRSPGWKGNSVSNNTELSKTRGLIEWWRSTGESWRALVSMIDCSVLQGTSLLSGSTQPSERKGDVQKSNLGTCTKGPVLQFRRFFLSSCTLIFLEILLWPNFTNFHSDFSLPQPSCFCGGAVTLSPYKALIPSCGLLSRNVIQPFPEAFCFVCFSLLDLLWTFGGGKKKVVRWRETVLLCEPQRLLSGGVCWALHGAGGPSPELGGLSSRGHRQIWQCYQARG